MAQLLKDSIDFAQYERDTECQLLVRKASMFADDLEEQFEPSKRRAAPSMLSTKLAHAIEFRPGEVTTWAGYNGHKKSMFTGQVTLDLCRQNQRSLVMSLEMPPGRTLGRMAKQACANDMPNAARRAEFMAWTDRKLWLFDHVGRLNPSKCLAVLRYFAEVLHGQHVFIDSFMKVCESEERLDEQKAMVGNLCDVAKETGLHVHLIAHCRKPNGGAEDKPPTKYDIKGSGAISDQCHNVILVWDNKPKKVEMAKQFPDNEVRKQPDFLVILDKQRNGEVEGKFGLSFDTRSLRFADSDSAPIEAYRMEAE